MVHSKANRFHIQLEKNDISCMEAPVVLLEDEKENGSTPEHESVDADELICAAAPSDDTDEADIIIDAS